MKEMLIADMLKKRQQISNKVGLIPSSKWCDVYYSGSAVVKDAIVIFKNRGNDAICGVGVFSSPTKMRLTPVYLSDGWGNSLSKPGEEIDVYLYNEKNNTMILCRVDTLANGIYVYKLIQGKMGERIWIQTLEEIGDVEVSCQKQ